VQKSIRLDRNFQSFYAASIAASFEGRNRPGRPEFFRRFAHACRSAAVNRDDQVREIKVLMDLVARSATTLAPAEMQIDARAFIDPEIHRRETRRLFREGPLCIGPSCLLKNPGDYWTFDDTGVPVVLVRTATGELKGYVNICSHRSAPVAVGSGTAKGMVLTCPYHGWSYSLDGRLRGIPYGKEGFPCVEKSERGLLEIPSSVTA
jgi:nitrite reductase/ring-hydroxylating ferredoxin subunit